jgi:hypothetical protein
MLWQLLFDLHSILYEIELLEDNLKILFYILVIYFAIAVNMNNEMNENKMKRRK